jgi:hypothetical protein
MAIARSGKKTDKEPAKKVPSAKKVQSANIVPRKVTDNNASITENGRKVIQMNGTVMSLTNNDEQETMEDPSPVYSSSPVLSGEEEYTGEGEGWDSLTSYPKSKHPDSVFATESIRATGTQEQSTPNSPAYSPTSPPYSTETPPPGDADPSRSPAH